MFLTSHERADHNPSHVTIQSEGLADSTAVVEFVQCGCAISHTHPTNKSIGTGSQPAQPDFVVPIARNKLPSH